MNVFIQKLNGLWHLIVGSCKIRTPFLETQDRELVVAYARRVYPGAKIFERDELSHERWQSWPITARVRLLPAPFECGCP